MKTQHELPMGNPEFRRLLAVESLTAEASELIARLMAERNLSNAALARKLGKSRSWITQLLSGSANMTVGTLAEIAYALDAEVRLHAQPAFEKRAVSSEIYEVRDSAHAARSAKSRQRLESPIRPGYAA